ncbi:hypothetical protein Krac_0155 [Ktedonobacter racemifer DSM 44963]|uniref:Transposase n=1 Tax=Ktedonobacter racemifer DSM 44963 TaxID=485913 RepID=D6U710_KTERA|nr:hypothetical protein Krac_0155 [Ktedonobacter racemifer DSM 44963]
MYRSARERARQGERTISMDELTGGQALERKHPDLPMQPGHVLRREFEYIRHGTLTWFINFDVVSGQVIAPSWGATRMEQDCLAHLVQIHGCLMPFLTLGTPAFEDSVVQDFDRWRGRHIDHLSHSRQADPS